MNSAKQYYFITLTAVMFFSFIPLVFAQEIMNFETYQKIDHYEPYILHLTTESGKLFYFGSRHSFDPEDPQMDSLSQHFKQFNPDVVFTEGFPQNVDSLDRKEIINRYGEAGLTWKLASNNNISVQSLEPKRTDEITYLKKQQWNDTHIILFYILRQVSQSNQKQTTVDFDSVLPKYLTSLKPRFGLNGPTTLRGFEKAVENLLPGVKNWREIPRSYFYPGSQKPAYFTNKIATDSNIFRDKYHVEILSKAVKKGHNVFSVIGSAHVVMQEPALKHRLADK